MNMMMKMKAMMTLLKGARQEAEAAGRLPSSSSPRSRSCDTGDEPTDDGEADDEEDW